MHIALVGGLGQPLRRGVQARSRLHLRARGLGALKRKERQTILWCSGATPTAASLYQAPRRALGASRSQGHREIIAASSTLV